MDTYENRWNKLLVTRVRSFSIRELTAGRADRILQDINKSHSTSTARTCRAVLSGICGLAAARAGVAPEERTGWVFPNIKGGLREANNMRRDWRAFRDRHDIGDWFTPRTWRRTVATLLTDELPAREASDVLGHSKVSQTTDTYVGRRAPSRRPATVLAVLGGEPSRQDGGSNSVSKTEP